MINSRVKKALNLLKWVFYSVLVVASIFAVLFDLGMGNYKNALLIVSGLTVFFVGRSLNNKIKKT